MSPRSQRPRRRMNPVPIEERNPARPVAAPVARGRGRVILPIAVGAATLGGAGYLAHRSRQKKDTVDKIFNPFEEREVFGKRYPVALPVASSTTVRALVPTGAHVGHANDLKVVRNRKGRGGPATRLEHYTGGGKAKHRQGPFGKAAALPNPSTPKAIARIAGQAKPSKPVLAPKTPLAVRLARGKQGPTSFQNPGSRGSRLT